MRRVTYREYLLWQEYLRQEWNEPSRTDYYLMTVARQVLAVNLKNPSLAKLDDFRLKFTFGEEGPDNRDAEAVAKERETKGNQVKNRWLAKLGIKTDGT